MSDSLYISVQQAANELSVSDQLIWKMIKKGTFPAKFIKFGAVIRIEKASWNAFLANGSTMPAPRKGRPPKATPPIDLQRQHDIFHAPQ